MKIFRCDHCGSENREPGVTLKGVYPGFGILLPSKFHEYNFCSEKTCFIDWMAEHFDIPRRHAAGGNSSSAKIT